MSNIAIRVEKISKQYKIGVAEYRHDSIREHLTEWVKSLFIRNGHTSLPDSQTSVHSGRLPVKGPRSSVDDCPDSIWALKDVSFEVKHGEAVGIIGRNGSGKSTLLKILSRITEPTSGTSDIHGRAGSLLEVGTGFHRDLTGRENIYLNGAIIGMRKAQIDRKFDEIVDFSGVEKFIDTPVKRYSSGMYVRLAFAVAAHLEPEILIVDEVLAVGDAAFQRKCLGRMESVAKEGRTVLFVSHNMSAIRSLCSRAILLAEGQVKGDGPPDQIVEQYNQVTYLSDGAVNLREREDRTGSGNVRVVSFEVRNATNNERSLWPGASAEFLVGYQARDGHPISIMAAGIEVCDSYGVGIFTCSTKPQNADFYAAPAQGHIRCRLDSLPLIPGLYNVTVKLIDNFGSADYVTRAATFEVVEGVQKCLDRKFGSVFVPHEWGLDHATAK